MSENINDILAEVMGEIQPKTRMNGLPIEVIQSKSAHHLKATRAASRLARLMQAAPNASEITEAIAKHKEMLVDLGFRAPKSLKECKELLDKLEA